MRNATMKMVIILLGLITLFPLPIYSFELLAEVQDKAAQTYQTAYNHILDENWKEAVNALEKVINTYPKSQWVDDARYWQCYATQKLDNDLEKAFKCYQNFIEKYPIGVFLTAFKR